MYWLIAGYVGYDPNLETIIVSHAGTNTSEMWALLHIILDDCWQLLVFLMILSLSLLTDANIIRSPLDSTLFPGLSSDITVHDGFADAQSKWVCLSIMKRWTASSCLSLSISSAAAILSAVQSGLATYGGNHVTVTGHSLGNYSLHSSVGV